MRIQHLRNKGLAVLCSVGDPVRILFNTLAHAAPVLHALL